MHLPQAHATARLNSILSLDDFVRSFSTTPQFGDESGDDRNIEHLWRQRASIRQELSAAKDALASDKIGKEVTRNSLLDEQRRLESDLNLLRTEVAALNTRHTQRESTWLEQEQVGVEARREQREVIARLKAEITDLRAATIGNAEDRGAAALEIETLREDVALMQGLSGQIKTLQEQLTTLREDTLKGMSNELVALREQVARRFRFR